MTDQPTPTNGFAQKYANILQTLVVIGFAIGGVWAGVINPVVAKVERIENQIDQKVTGTLSIREHEEFKSRLDQIFKGLQEQVHQQQLDIAFLRDNQVTRAEHTTHWDQQKEAIATNRSEVDQLRKDFGGQYTIGKKVDDLQSQIDRQAQFIGQLAGALTHQMPPLNLNSGK